MSNIVLQPNASGTGSITIASPNTNTNRTLNIPDVAGNIVTTGDTGSVSSGMLNNTLNLSGKTVSNFTNPNGWNLLLTKEDTSTVSYGSDTLIFDFSSYLSTYNTFHIDLYYYAVAGSGSQHFFNTFYDNAGSRKDLRYLHHGYSQDSSTATPSVGTGGYWRTGFSVQNSTAYIHQMTITNGRLSDTSMDVSVQCHSVWYREGSGVSQASGGCQVSDGSAIAKYYINMDQSTASGGDSGRVYARLWGVY